MNEKIMHQASFHQAVQQAMDEFSPGSRLVAVDELPGSFSNTTCRIHAADADGNPFAFIARVYAVHGQYDLGIKAKREFHAYQMLRGSGIPVPEPLYIDAEARLFERPTIFTSLLPGEYTAGPGDPHKWATQMGTLLANIHSFHVDPAQEPLLMDGNDEAVWYLHEGEVPEYMLSHPLGEKVWHTLNTRFRTLPPVEPSLIHIDYWHGNLLWKDDVITGVVDWEEAGFGDPALDVGYCYMDMCIRGYADAADLFLQTYRNAAGRMPENFWFWALAATPRPMYSWGLEDPKQLRDFSAFIEKALKELGY